MPGASSRPIVRSTRQVLQAVHVARRACCASRPAAWKCSIDSPCTMIASGRSERIASTASSCAMQRLRIARTNAAVALLALVPPPLEGGEVGGDEDLVHRREVPDPRIAPREGARVLGEQHRERGILEAAEPRRDAEVTEVGDDGDARARAAAASARRRRPSRTCSARCARDSRAGRSAARSARTRARARSPLPSGRSARTCPSDLCVHRQRSLDSCSRRRWRRGTESTTSYL